MAASPEVYEVEKILARRESQKGKIEYLVRWKNYTSDDDSWEPLSNLGACIVFIEEFNKRMQHENTNTDKKNTDDKKTNKSSRKPTVIKKPKIKKKKLPNKLEKSSKHSKSQKSDVKLKHKNETVRHIFPKKKKTKADTVVLISPAMLPSDSSLSDFDLSSLSSDDEGVRYRLADTMYLETPSPDSNGVVTFNNKSKHKKRKQGNNKKTESPKFNGKEKDCTVLLSSCNNGMECNNAASYNDTGSPARSKGPSIMTPLSKQKPESQAASGLHSPSKLGYYGNSPLTSYKSLLGSTPKKHLPERTFKRKLSEICDDDSKPLERRLSVRQSESVYKYKEIVVKKASGYTQIWLFTNTTVKNAINPQVCKEIINALCNATYDDSRVVMISGSGSVFCSGIDLNYLADRPIEQKKKTAREMTDALRELIYTIIKFPKLLVAAVNGPAVGLGASILPLCDIVYASDKAFFHTPYARLAQTPEGCSSYTFPLIMGPAMANEMLLGCKKLTAIEACQKGLVSQVFWPTSFMQEVIPRLQNLAAVSVKGLQVSKALIRSHSNAKLEYTNESECQALQERWGSTECYKAIKSFVADENEILVYDVFYIALLCVKWFSCET
ncbi:chromodomain Y-like protein 2 [Saccoglossus kowalevskii]|uniref:Chromodomain Y-like protein 2-like n=1 Tax=Saccoglossus kowalevskii TaxID=10224 RepID=A0ABM0MYU3_SACKO|nr:PREDICTED: chromodomain Y-like protein 2-like [Saccoglossus kowalevskii]